MAEQANFQFKHLTASAVVSGTGAAGSQSSDNFGKQSVLHAVNINQMAANATINVYDYNSITSPANLIAAFAPGAAAITSPTGQLYDCICMIGITVVITGTVDVTVTYK